MKIWHLGQEWHVIYWFLSIITIYWAATIYLNVEQDILYFLLFLLTKTIQGKDYTLHLLIVQFGPKLENLYIVSKCQNQNLMKVMTNLDSIFKSRDITLPTKVRLVKAMVFPVVMYGCESWIVRKAERRRIDAFELWFWRRLLRVPWTARRSNQSIVKEISPGISLEGMMLKLKLQYFGHLMRRVDSLEKTLMLGGIGGRRTRGRQRIRGWMASLTRWTWVWVNSGSWWWTGRPGMLRFMGSQRDRHDWVTELSSGLPQLLFSHCSILVRKVLLESKSIMITWRVFSESFLIIWLILIILSLSQCIQD